METKSNTFRIVLTALMVCLIMVAILFIRVPIPFTQGYVHLGDAMVFLSVLILRMSAGLCLCMSDSKNRSVWMTNGNFRL